MPNRKDRPLANRADIIQACCGVITTAIAVATWHTAPVVAARTWVAGYFTSAVPPPPPPSFQKALGVKITLQKPESAEGSLSFGFDFVNEGVQEIRHFNVYGGGTLGMGGSSLVANGMEVPASTVDFAGQVNRPIAHADLIPGVHYQGKLNFNGVYTKIEEVELVRLGISVNHISPQARADFRLTK